MTNLQKIDLSPFRFFYVNPHLGKYDLRTFNPEDDCIDTESILYEKNGSYRSHTKNAENNAVSLMNFVKKYEERKGKIIEQTKIAVIVAFPYLISDPRS